MALQKLKYIVNECHYVALYDDTHLTEDQVVSHIKTGQKSRYVAVVTIEQFQNVFADLFRKEPPAGATEDGTNHPRVGEHVWAVVKDSFNFQLKVVAAVVTQVDARVFCIEWDIRPLSASTCTMARAEWLRSVFPTEAEAAAGMDRLIREQRFNP